MDRSEHFRATHHLNRADESEALRCALGLVLAYARHLEARLRIEPAVLPEPGDGRVTHAWEERS